MKVTAEKMDNHEVVLTIEVEAEVLKKAEAKACKDLANRVSIPGFRKGKAPRHIIEQRVGKQAILDTAFDAVADKAFADALKEQDVTPVSRPDIEVVTLEEGKDVVFKARFTAKPEVTLGEYKGIQVEKKVDEITDEDIDKEIESMRRRRSQMVDAAEGAEVKNGDLVTLDFKGFVDGEAFEGGEGKDYPLEIGSNRFIPGFEDQLIGHKSGEDVTVKVTFPQDYRNKDVAGKDAEFSVKINSVEKTPELTDEWVKNYQETTAETVDAFRTQMKERMVAGSDYNYHMEIQQKALADIVDKSEITLSDSMKKYATAYAIRSQLDQIEKYGMKISDMLNMYGTSVQDFRTQMETQGEEYGKQYFVIQKIAADQGIKLNDDLINKVAENATKITGKEYNKDKLIEEFGKETIESEAVTMAVLDYIESKVKTTVQEETSEVPESSTAAPAESSTAAK